jgi:hypothetical protein
MVSSFDWISITRTRPEKHIIHCLLYSYYLNHYKEPEPADIYIMLFISTLATLALALPATAAPQPIPKRDLSDLSLNAQLRLAET